MKNIVLIGMMGCGKTTCARLLAQKLGREMVDTDALIAAREERCVSDIFATEGEEYFRALETAAARELGARSDLIIATGGGLPLRRENVDALSSNGVLFWLMRDPAATFSSESMEGRPLAQEGLAAFVARFEQRAPHYRAAAHHVITDFTDPETTVQAILTLLDNI